MTRVLTRIRAFVRLRRARLRALVGIIKLVVAFRRGSVDEVWVGDSHTVLFNIDHGAPPGLLRTAERRWTWHLGPRMMYSIAKKGLPTPLLRTGRVLAKIPAAREAAWFFSFGDVDIRCHLVPRMKAGQGLGFVAEYVDRVYDVLATIGARTGTICIPPPPTLDTDDHELFPVVGTPEQRLDVHGAVREALYAAVATERPGPKIRLLDLTKALADSTGLMQPEFTMADGLHTNDAGRAVVRREIERLPRA